MKIAKFLIFLSLFCLINNHNLSKTKLIKDNDFQTISTIKHYSMPITASTLIETKSENEHAYIKGTLIYKNELNSNEKNWSIGICYDKKANLFTDIDLYFKLKDFGYFEKFHKNPCPGNKTQKIKRLDIPVENISLTKKNRKNNRFTYGVKIFKSSEELKRNLLIQFNISKPTYDQLEKLKY